MDEQTKAGTATNARSGDTHVIDGSADHADAVNVEQAARDAAARAAARAPTPRAKPPVSSNANPASGE